MKTELNEERFNSSSIKKLSSGDFIKFRDNFLNTLRILRDRNVPIDLDAIRMQSIKNDILLIGPRYLSLEISGRCNYKCSFCADQNSALWNALKRKEKRKYTNDFLPFCEIKKIVDQAYMMGTMDIDIIGLGEPFLHPDILRIASTIINKGFNTTIFTNASTSKIVYKMAEFPVSSKLRFIVNLCAVNAEKYASIHGQDPKQFEKILKMIKILNGRHDVIMGYVVQKENINDLEEYIALTGRLGVKKIRVKFLNYQLFNNPNRKQTYWSSSWRREKEMLPVECSYEEIISFTKKLKKYIALSKNNNVHLNLGNLKTFFEQKDKLNKLYGCYESWYSAHVDMDGNLHNCCQRKEPITKIKNGNFKDAFFSHAFTDYGLRCKKYQHTPEFWKECEQICENIMINNNIYKALKSVKNNCSFHYSSFLS